jgi:hypothetical protein
MEISITKPIENFINRQLAKGYVDAGEVARQALLRWMEDEEFDPEPPHLHEKIREARRGEFHLHNPQKYDVLLTSPNASAR